MHTIKFCSLRTRHQDRPHEKYLDVDDVIRSFLSFFSKFHVAARPFGNWSEETPKCGKNITDILGAFFVLITSSTAKRNLFVEVMT